MTMEPTSNGVAMLSLNHRDTESHDGISCVKISTEIGSGTTCSKRIGETYTDGDRMLLIVMEEEWQDRYTN